MIRETPIDGVSVDLLWKSSETPRKYRQSKFHDRRGSFPLMIFILCGLIENIVTVSICGQKILELNVCSQTSAEGIHAPANRASPIVKGLKFMIHKLPQNKNNLLDVED